MAASVELMHFHKRNQDSIVDLQQQIDQPVQQEVKGNRINRNKIKCVFDQVSHLFMFFYGIGVPCLASL